MTRHVRVFGIMLLILATSTASGFATENPTKIRVALLDMSSSMPTGTMGYGMMGPGMMGSGPFGSAPWMTGPGGGGPGMMGYGYGVGPGMMGYGMMSIRVDQPTVKAGPVTFDVTNWSRSVLHEMLIVSADNPSAPLPYDYQQIRVPEEQVKVLGEVADLQPNSSQALDVTLTPGTYLLICNLPGHYAAGMASALNVTP